MVKRMQECIANDFWIFAAILLMLKNFLNVWGSLGLKLYVAHDQTATDWGAHLTY
jgi:hypothetical protein